MKVRVKQRRGVLCELWSWGHGDQRQSSGCLLCKGEAAPGAAPPPQHKGRPQGQALTRKWKAIAQKPLHSHNFGVYLEGRVLLKTPTVGGKGAWGSAGERLGCSQRRVCAHHPHRGQEGSGHKREWPGSLTL